MKRRRANRLDLKGLFDILQKELGGPDDDPAAPAAAPAAGAVADPARARPPKFSNDLKRTAQLTGAYNLASSMDAKDRDKGKARDAAATPAASVPGKQPAAAPSAATPSDAAGAGVSAGSVALQPLSPRGGGARAAQIQQVLQAQQRAFAEQLSQETERLRGVYLRRLQDALADVADARPAALSRGNSIQQLGD